MNTPLIRASAGALGDAFGRKLLGHVVVTQPMGDYQGGCAVVIEHVPDAGAPEIAYMVRNIRTNEEIGIFRDEQLDLMIEVNASMAAATAMTLGDACKDMLAQVMEGKLPDFATMQKAMLALVLAGFVSPAMSRQPGWGVGV